MQAVEGPDGDPSVDAPNAFALGGQAGERRREPPAVQDGLPGVDVLDAWERRRLERQALRIGLVSALHPRIRSSRSQMAVPPKVRSTTSTSPPLWSDSAKASRASNASESP
jgi:hypothetical protein